MEKKEETNWLKEINSQTLQFAINCLETAYDGFFAGRSKFPNFKSKRSKNSFTVPQFTKIKNEKLVIPKFQEGIQMIMEKKVTETIKKATIWNDKEVIHIDRFFPSSKTCNSCGWINKNLELKDRLWTCGCGLNHNRDLNAAKNILNEGLRKNISVGTTDHGRGAQIRLEKSSKGYETSKKKILSGSETQKSLAFCVDNF